MDTTKLTVYWRDASEEKWKTAEALMKSERYADALFFCHLTLEALLKAAVVVKTKEYPPYQHDLVDLARRAGVSLDEKKTEELAEITTFNIRARYDDFKLSFYRKATKEYATRYFDTTNQLRIWIKNTLQ